MRLKREIVSAKGMRHRIFLVGGEGLFFLTKTGKTEDRLFMGSLRECWCWLKGYEAGLSTAKGGRDDRPE